MTPQDQSSWDDVYQFNDVESLPWFYSKLDSDFERVLSAISGSSKRVLDVGTGPGTQATELAKRGFKVVATDISPTAIAKARVLAREQGVEVDFRQDDFVNTKLEPAFDYIFDRGVFHTFNPSQRQVYCKNVYHLLVPDGYLLIKCFSHLQPGSDGPHRFSPAQLRSYFEEFFNIVSIEDTTFRGKGNFSVKALFSIMQRREQ
ncbi:class I SAM-dependent methyltransferase [Patescibacteria group bacterium]|nr:class I SAM-dependent methyltransferase [Patescibacteria group bacterium]